MNHRSMLRLSLPLLALSISSAANAHGGGLDANGCHTNRETGEYHCHRAQSTPPSPSASSSTPRASQPTTATPSYLLPQAEAAPPAPVPAPAPAVRATTPVDDPDLVKAAQLLLPSIGYEAGAATGQTQELTLAAVRRFQDRHGLPANGRITAALVATISRDVLDVSRQRHQRILQLEAAAEGKTP